MKSCIEKLASRGYITDDIYSKYKHCNEQTLITMLLSTEPSERTAAVKLLGETKNARHIPLLIGLFKKEKKLYTNLELIKQLSSYKKEAVPFLIEILGTIGKNQHKEVKTADLNKKSYPLPRDIAARALIKIGIEALQELENIIIQGSLNQVSEAIDCIGHISFYSDVERSECVLFKALNKYEGNDLIKWKIIRAFQAFKSDKVLGYFNSVIIKCFDKTLKAEAVRSLARIKSRKKLFNLKPPST